MHLKNISKVTFELIRSNLPWSTILPSDRKFYIFLRRNTLYKVDDVGSVFNLIRKTWRYYEIFTDFLHFQSKVNRTNAIWIYLIQKLLSLFLYSRKVFKIKSSFRSTVFYFMHFQWKGRYHPNYLIHGLTQKLESTKINSGYSLYPASSGSASLMLFEPSFSLQISVYLETK